MKESVVANPVTEFLLGLLGRHGEPDDKLRSLPFRFDLDFDHVGRFAKRTDVPALIRLGLDLRPARFAANPLDFNDLRVDHLCGCDIRLAAAHAKSIALFQGCSAVRTRLPGGRGNFQINDGVIVDELDVRTGVADVDW